jgi:hypothetical protein
MTTCPIDENLSEVRNPKWPAGVLYLHEKMHWFLYENDAH